MVQTHSSQFSLSMSEEDIEMTDVSQSQDTNVPNNGPEPESARGAQGAQGAQAEHVSEGAQGQSSDVQGMSFRICRPLKTFNLQRKTR